MDKSNKPIKQLSLFENVALPLARLQGALEAYSFPDNTDYRFLDLLDIVKQIRSDLREIRMHLDTYSSLAGPM